MPQQLLGGSERRAALLLRRPRPPEREQRPTLQPPTAARRARRLARLGWCPREGPAQGVVGAQQRVEGLGGAALVRMSHLGLGPPCGPQLCRRCARVHAEEPPARFERLLLRVMWRHGAAPQRDGTVEQRQLDRPSKLVLLDVLRMLSHEKGPRLVERAAESLRSSASSATGLPTDLCHDGRNKAVDGNVAPVLLAGETSHAMQPGRLNDRHGGLLGGLQCIEHAWLRSQP